MSINIISHRISELVQSQTKPFTSHDLISILMQTHRVEWEQLVDSYTGERLRQEQKAVQQVGRYLCRYAEQLGVLRGRTMSSAIENLSGHNSRETTEWL